MREIRIAHNPDSDEAFMFYALANNVFDGGDLKFTPVLKDIETRNDAELKGEYQVSANSIHAYPSVAGKYILLPTGCGPMSVSKNKISINELSQIEIATPGLNTTALLLFNPNIRFKVALSDQIIHEGQQTYAHNRD